MGRRGLGAVAFALGACLVLSTLPGRAATGPVLVLTDPAGDANGINDEAQGAPLTTAFGSGSGIVTPKDVEDLDILSISMQTDFNRKRKPTALDIFLKLAADPASDQLPHQYIFYFDTSRCAGNKIRWEFTPHHPAGLPDDTALITIWTHELTFYPGKTCQDVLKDIGSQRLTFSTQSGSTLIARIPFAMTAPGKMTWTQVSNIRVESRFRFRQSQSYPVADIAFDPSKTYRGGR